MDWDYLQCVRGGSSDYNDKKGKFMKGRKEFLHEGDEGRVGWGND